eukprot:s341_g15.t1
MSQHQLAEISEMPQAFCSVLLLMRLCSHWRYTTCREVEKKDDFVCQNPVDKAKVQRVLMSFACYFETTIECQVVFVILCCYGLCAMVSLLGSFIGLYGVLQLQRHLEGAGEISGSTVSVTEWKDALKAWSKAIRGQDWSSALQLLRSLDKKCIQKDAGRSLKASVVSFGAVLRSFSTSEASSSAWTWAMQVLGDLRETGLRANETLAIAACCEAQRWFFALQLFSELHQQQLRRSIVSYSTATSACRWLQAWQMIQESRAGGVAMNAVPYNAAANACDDWESSLQLFTEVQRIRVSTSITYGPLVQKRCKAPAEGFNSDDLGPT